MSVRSPRHGILRSPSRDKIILAPTVAPVCSSISAIDGIDAYWSKIPGAKWYHIKWGSSSGVYTNEFKKVTDFSMFLPEINSAPVFWVVAAVNESGTGPFSVECSAAEIGAGILDFSDASASIWFAILFSD